MVGVTSNITNKGDVEVLLVLGGTIFIMGLFSAYFPQGRM